MEFRNYLDRSPKVVEEEATSTLMEERGERRDLRTRVNMVRSLAVGGELCAPELFCEVHVLRLRSTKT